MKKRILTTLVLTCILPMAYLATDMLAAGNGSAVLPQPADAAPSGERSGQIAFVSDRDEN